MTLVILIKFLAKMNYKKIYSVIILSVVAGIIFPGLLLAQTSSDVLRGKALCDRIIEVSQRVLNRIVQRETQAEQIFSERLDNIMGRLSDVQEKIDERRTKWQENRDKHYGKISEKAQSDPQKQALAELKQTIEQAIADRKSKIDQARVDFRTSFENLVSARHQAVIQAINDYKADLEAAYNKAKTDCELGLAAKTLRDALASALKDAKTKLQNAKTQVDGFRDLLSPIVQARNEAIRKAQEDFRAIVDKAKDDFKAAWGSE